MDSEKLKFDITEIFMDHLKTPLQPSVCSEHSLRAADLGSGSHASVFYLLL
jgi:hypothetical protein